MKYIFIVNEGAGKGKSQKILPKIEKECQKRKYDYVFIGSSIAISVFSIVLLQYSPIRMREKQNEQYSFQKRLFFIP